MQSGKDINLKNDRASELAALTTNDGTATAALALFDSLPPVSLEEMHGRWRGEGLPTGHPMDGLLERFGWYGKEFSGPDDVQPLLCKGRGGEVFAMNPAFVPIGFVIRHIGLFHTRFAGAMVALAGRAAATRQPTARLRMTEYRGVVTATMIYDSLPINDMFRAVDSNTRLGVMDLRGMAQPFFFVLHRDCRS
jgi:GXWXG protein/Domain of unknown function (DUF4334)